VTATLGTPQRSGSLAPPVLVGGSVRTEAGRPARPDVLPRTLAEARKAAGLTVGAMAEAMFCSRSNVSQWERAARRPPRAYWPRLGALLGLEPEQLARLLADHPPARFDARPLPSLGAVRRQRGLTQRGLADIVGVAPTTLAMWENAGTRVAQGVADELARVLDTDVAVLAAAQRPTDPAPDPRPLRQLRISCRMSLREAATHLRIARITLVRYEGGERRPPVHVIRGMALLYRRPLRELLDLCGIRLAPLPAGRPWRSEDVAEGLRAARTAVGLSRAGLGRVVDRSGQAVRGWEEGRTLPAAPTRRRLERVLGLPVGTLP